MHLRPCSACGRHVRGDVTRCPFCDQALAHAGDGEAPEPARLSRAACLALGAAAVVSLSACGNSPPANTVTVEPAPSGTATATATATTATTAKTALPPPQNPPYGGPPVDLLSGELV